MSTVLDDIAPGPKTAVIAVNGKNLTVTDFSARVLHKLFDRFPALESMKGSAEGEQITDEQTMALADAAPAIIAAGVGEYGNSDAEKAAERFLLEDQMRLVTKILELSLPAAPKRDLPLETESGSAPSGSATAQTLETSSPAQ